jgi:hypothetical protein
MATRAPIAQDVAPPASCELPGVVVRLWLLTRVRRQLGGSLLACDRQLVVALPGPLQEGVERFEPLLRLLCHCVPRYGAT